MKKQIAFLGAAAAALMMAGTAHAQGGGYVGLSYSNNNDTDINSWSIDGAVAAGANVQIDAGYTNFDDIDADGLDIGGHFFSRGSEWLWGGFVGYNRLSGSGGEVHEWTVALQTQYYMDRSTISGDLSYSTVDLGGDVNTTQIDGEARFFPTDNFSIQGNLGYGNVDSFMGGGGDFWSYGVGAEWQPDSMPVSFTAGLQGWNGDGSDTSAWTIGARYTWGGTLLERNRSGAGLNEPRGFLAILY